MIGNKVIFTLESKKGPSSKDQKDRSSNEETDNECKKNSSMYNRKNINVHS